MYTLDLECEAGHRFEGWYDSSEDYEEAVKQGNIFCPICDSEFVMRSASAHTVAGKALMNIARKLQSDKQNDLEGTLYFRLRLD